MEKVMLIFTSIFLASLTFVVAIPLFAIIIGITYVIYHDLGVISCLGFVGVFTVACYLFYKDIY